MEVWTWDLADDKLEDAGPVLASFVKFRMSFYASPAVCLLKSEDKEDLCKYNPFKNLKNPLFM